ncbi:MAG: R3H domain-containing nucleic acid-binding protein [Candidatus Limnocylindrales bacterium]
MHRSQSRPKPSPREALTSDRFGSDRFAGLVGAGPGWRTEPGWRGAGSYHAPADWRDSDRGPARPGYRPGSSGGWRTPARGGRETRESAGRTRGGEAAGRGDPGAGAPDQGRPGGRGDGFEARTVPGERFAAPPIGPGGIPGEVPFRAGELADRGPIERGAAPVPEPRARELRELERQRSWTQQATRALNDYRAEGVEEEEDEEESGEASLESTSEEREDLVDEAPADDDEAVADAVRLRAGNGGAADEDGRPVLRVRDSGTILPTLRVLPHGISRKRLEQAIKELQLPVIIARDPDEADVVMTLKSEYRQKTAGLRDAEDRGLPIYVLKSNTIVQMEASLTSIFSLEVDPREAALREAEEAIGMVIRHVEPVELSPQNAYIRRLQHQMAERANLISRSRGREPYRRVRLYP